MSTEGRPSPGAPAEERGGCPRLSPWALLILAFILKACVTCGCLVALLKGHQSCGDHRVLPQDLKEGICVLERHENKEQVWMCCPIGWKLFHTSCYYLSNNIMTWAESETNCTGMGSHLVVISTKAEQEFLFNWIKGAVAGSQEKNHYIGLSAQEMEGQWHWVDQTLYNQTTMFWRPGEPNNPEVEKCAVMYVGGQADDPWSKNWNNIPCETDCYRICEVAATRI
ncbi:C-type lectin domain family 4 member D [Alligator mississippiensis]|uniref:C-type lectin domain family 4 member D n=1 Tax=Alligator mississippiensis TaxID=8496 RepID=A0A151NA13_ALLMI|nr:C-type lectin domain family 4 member D [Alligator mississippiensis]KYO33335.1 C-type lectin domain family 4 member D [Alligator mississippiensis]